MLCCIMYYNEHNYKPAERVGHATHAAGLGWLAAAGMEAQSAAELRSSMRPGIYGSMIIVLHNTPAHMLYITSCIMYVLYINAQHTYMYMHSIHITLCYTTSS